MRLPFPLRFRSYEDAKAYFDNPNPSLPIPTWIEENGWAKINPEYVNAPWEQALFLIHE